MTFVIICYHSMLPKSDRIRQIGGNFYLYHSVRFCLLLVLRLRFGLNLPQFSGFSLGIRRCERALGEALEWRLWVGKMPAFGVLSRSQSAGELFIRASSNRSIDPLDAAQSPGIVTRHSSTLPAQVFLLAAQPINNITRMQEPPSLATPFSFHSSLASRSPLLLL